MSLEKLKLSKPLVSAMTAAGYLTPKEIQGKTMSRIIGGQDIVAIGPDQCGKTTTYVLGILMRLKYGFEEAPRALILVPSNEKVDEVIKQFELLNKNKSIRIVGIKTDGNVETQINDITDGVDIVVAVPTRARAIYLKLGLNVNKIQTLVIDDAAEMVKQGLQLPINELANSIQKCQHLVFSNVLHDRIEKMIEAFMKLPTYIEVEDLGDHQVATYTQVFYHVPNFRTKLNLLNVLLLDKEVFDKAVVLVNTRLTAQTIAKDIFNGKAEDVFILKPLFYDDAGFDNIEDFKADNDARILIIANEVLSDIDLTDIPFVFHFELPENIETYLSRIVKKDDTQDLVALTLVTDLELSPVKKIEQAIGQKIDFSELPEGLVIDDIDKSKTKKPKVVEEDFNLAFHQKKASNAKTANYGAGKKAKMDNKRKHS